MELTILASVFYLSSLLSGGAVVHEHMAFTHYLSPEIKNASPVMQEQKEPVALQPKQSLEETEPVSVLPTAVPTRIPTKVPPPSVQMSNFDAIYQEAGSKYGIPWQILYGLHITETGGRDGMIMSGSGSGARGPMQFMPGTWGAYGVDGNGDGVADIDNAVDAIHGAANYLAKHGSLASGLRSYGGNTAGVLRLAQERGFTE